ncbi:ATP-binding protein [Scandinavium goeteborgense]|uniref:histidine kinase n=1 Tax=Scandinavium goeteborgense TaxID=1851514 RepID=A0A4R6E178_SCAGO|nr:transporter substrate-binding domain-containing protein [Scandinavium goeteborgense]TDN51476.1 two-component system sensor histidine kinase EvgS [Scandinavium goeteborgense]
MLRWWLIAWTVLSIFCGQVLASENELQLLARSKFVIENPGLSGQQWRWVREHRLLRVAVWLPMSPPYDITTGLNDYGGINADFLGLIAENLNIRIEILRYPSYHDAISALVNGKADLIAQSGKSQYDRHMLLTRPYSINTPVEVENIDSPSYQHKRRIAICPQLSSESILEQFPGGQLVKFPSNRLALEALMFRHLDIFICDVTTTQYLISQSNFSNLSTRPVYPSFIPVGFAFAALPKNKPWIEVINNILEALPDNVSVEIHRRWNGGFPLSLSEQYPVYTPLEHKWIKNHHNIRVAVVDGNSPISWINASDQLHGIMSDLLTALRLRTGFKFEIRPYPNFDSALKAVESGESDLVAGATQKNIWQHNLLTTRTWLYNSWVMVGKKNARVSMHSPRIVALRDQRPTDWLQLHDDGNVISTDTWRTGLLCVMQDKCDIMFAPLLVADDWLSADEFSGLKILGSVDTAPMRFSLGVSQDLYPLVMILNKALINIPPEELHAITSSSASTNEHLVSAKNFFFDHKSLWISLAVILIVLTVLSSGYLIVLQRRLNILKKSKVISDNANEIKSHFIATMSHELRTPVSAIIGLIELVLKRPQDAVENQKRIQAAWQGGQSLLALIGNILDVSRIEAGKLTLYPCRTPLLPLLESIALLFEGVAALKGLTFYLEMDSELKDDVFVDPLRLRQIISNLLGNAIKFTPSGSVTLRAIHHQAEKDNRINLQIDVQDTGKGISPLAQKNLFERFSQGDNKQTGEGSGLGLYICRRLIDMMGGDMVLQSQPRQGTLVTVHLCLPLLPAAIDTLTGHPAQEIICPDNLQVFVVDDNSAGRMLLEHQFMHLGHHPTSFTSAKALLAYLEHHRADLIVTDCNMPEMDGFELATLIHQHYPETRLLGITADARDSTRLAAIAAGMDGCLFKPVTLEQLTDCIQSLTFTNALPTIRLPATLLEGENGRVFLTLQINELEEMLLWLTQNNGINQPELPSRLHRLRGGLQLLGVPDIEALCIRLEQRMTEQGLAELETALTYLRDTLKLSLQGLKTVLHENGDADAS